jgi:hypothetical protein
LKRLLLKKCAIKTTKKKTNALTPLQRSQHQVLPEFFSVSAVTFTNKFPEIVYDISTMQQLKRGTYYTK